MASAKTEMQFLKEHITDLIRSTYRLIQVAEFRASVPTQLNEPIQRFLPPQNAQIRIDLAQTNDIWMSTVTDILSKEWLSIQKLAIDQITAAQLPLDTLQTAFDLYGPRAIKQFNIPPHHVPTINNIRLQRLPLASSGNCPPPQTSGADLIPGSTNPEDHTLGAVQSNQQPRSPPSNQNMHSPDPNQSDQLIGTSQIATTSGNNAQGSLKRTHMHTTPVPTTEDNSNDRVRSPTSKRRFIEPSLAKSTPRYHQVKGKHNILSNFAPTPIVIQGQQYKSVEHAYQCAKAKFHNKTHVHSQILSAADGPSAKRLAKQLIDIPLSRDINMEKRISEWLVVRLRVITILMREKFTQNSPARTDLLQTDDKIIFHPVNDPFWGTGSADPSVHKTTGGQDIFSTILMHIRAQISGNSPPVELVDLPDSVKLMDPDLKVSDLLHCAGQPDTVNQSKQIVPLLELRLPEPDRPNRINPVVLNAHDKTTLRLPKISEDLLILGDSQLSRTSNLESRASVKIIAIPGIKFRNLTHIIRHSESQPSPTKVVLAVGINTRAQNPHSTSAEDLKKLISTANRLFPRAQIYLPQVSFSTKLSIRETSNLKELNQCMKNIPNVTVIPLPPFYLQFQDSVHITVNSMHQLANYWINKIENKGHR